VVASCGIDRSYYCAVGKTESDYFSRLTITEFGYARSVAPANSRSAATRQRLLDAAVDDLVARDGTLEVGSVADRAGVSTGALYHHFGSKGGLLGALVHDFYARLDEEVVAPSLAEHGDWAQREQARIKRTVAFQYREPLATVLATLAREPEVAAADAPYMAELIAAAERNLRAAQRDGEISSDIDAGIAAATIIGGIRQALAQVLARKRRPDPDFVADELWRLVRAAIHHNERPLPRRVRRVAST
jgi:AcrR family transcriptional regulator